MFSVKEVFSGDIYKQQLKKSANSSDPPPKRNHQNKQQNIKDNNNNKQKRIKIVQKRGETLKHELTKRGYFWKKQTEEWTDYS